MSEDKVNGHQLELVKAVHRQLPSGRHSYSGRMGLWIKGRRLVEVDQALLLLKQTKPGASLSSIVCDAIIESASLSGSDTTQKSPDNSSG